MDDKFVVEQEDAFSAAFELLLSIASRQRAFESIIVPLVAERLGRDIEGFVSEYETAIMQEKEQLYKDLFSEYASLKKMLGGTDPKTE